MHACVWVCVYVCVGLAGLDLNKPMPVLPRWPMKWERQPLCCRPPLINLPGLPLHVCICIGVCVCVCVCDMHVFAYVWACMHVMFVCVCASSDHLCLRLQLCDARIEIWRDLISHTPKPNVCMSVYVFVCVCVRAPWGVISHQRLKRVTLKHHRVDSSSDIWVVFFSSSCRLSHFYPCAHIRLRRIRGHVTNLWSTQRQSRER